ncbi:MAG TPA: c-type cytochrome, partial [Candidatus Limnocylindrales bacterium]
MRRHTRVAVRTQGGVMPDRRAVGGLSAIVAVGVLGWAATLGPFVAAAVPTPPKPEAGPGGQVTNLSRGGELFQTSCASCHGQQGQGTPNGPPLTNAGAASADFMLRTGRMPQPAPNTSVRRPNPAFSEQDIQDLVAFVASLGAGPPIPNVQVSATTDTAAGRAAYIATCAACHGAGASGDAVGGGAFAPSLHATAPTQVGEA